MMLFLYSLMMGAVGFWKLADSFCEIKCASILSWGDFTNSQSIYNWSQKSILQSENFYNSGLYEEPYS